MTILQFSLALSSSSSSFSSSASFPVLLGSNFKIPSKYIPSLSHFLNSKHSHLLHLPNSRVSGSPTNKSRFSKSKITCSAKSVDLESSEIVKEKSVSVILLAGGKGKRMGANMPKQYLPLLGQPIALYSFYTFSHMIEVKEIIVVCDPSYKDIFEDIKENIHVDLKFTLPGKERQDSVYSGLQAVDVKSELVCIHDSARPLVTTGDVKKLILLKASGQVIYSGPLGQHSSSGIEYFEATSGVQKIRNNYNPATWMLEITSRSAEAQLCIDFAQVYKNCVLYQNNREHVNRWSTPPPDSFELNSQQGVFNPLCSIFSATIFLGINNSSSVLPYAAAERSRCMVRGLMHLLRSRLRFCISKSK